MAVGVPIVASDIAPVREAVGREENAHLVPPAEPVRLATAIADLLENPATARMLAQRGRDQFETHAGVEQTCAQIAAFYRDVAFTSRPTRGMLARCGSVR
jgi:glycosyltransferase involved in cell wall biosynthesis